MNYHYTPIMLAELKFKNTKYWWGHGESGSHTVLVGMKNGTGFLENSLAVLLKKQNIHCTFDHLSQRNENFCPHKNLYMIVHSSFICNRPNQNKMFCSRWMVNQTVIIQIYIYISYSVCVSRESRLITYRILPSNKKRWTIVKHNNLNGSQRHNEEWKKPMSKSYIYESIYMHSWNMKLHKWKQ